MNIIMNTCMYIYIYNEYKCICMYLLKYTRVYKCIYIIISISIGLKITKTFHFFCAIHDFRALKKCCSCLPRHASTQTQDLQSSENRRHPLGVFRSFYFVRSGGSMKTHGVHGCFWFPLKGGIGSI